MKKRNWYRLDNAAKIYPPTSSIKRGAMFAFSAMLNEEVDKDILNEAVALLLNRFPTFKVSLKRGIFWYYLEENNKPFFVEPEPPYFLEFINEEKTNDYLFRVFYSDKKITMAAYHVLSDGVGGSEVFKALLYEYLNLKGCSVKSEGEIRGGKLPATDAEIDDSFHRSYDKNVKKPPKEKTAFRLYGTAFDVFGEGVITGKVKVDEIKALAKKYNATITEFITGLAMHFIYKNWIEGKKIKNKLVRVLVPVNMRSFYPSETIRNFALFTRPEHNYENPITLEECIASCSEQIKKGTTKEALDKHILYNVKSEKNWLIKIVPLFIKDFIMRQVYKKVGDNLQTTTVSNVGIFKLPESFKPYVKDIVVIIGSSFVTKETIAVVSYGENMNITFSRTTVETKLEKDFFRYLSENGVKAEISSNYWEEAK